MVKVHSERMSAVFEKWHIEGLPVSAVFHRFGDVDRGDPHDHPWGFRSIILHGGYVERVFNLDGSSELVRRQVGDSFEIAAAHIHRIEDLENGECWTLILPGRNERTSRFWQFRDDGAYSRAWHENEWIKGRIELFIPPAPPQWPALLKLCHVFCAASSQSHTSPL